MYSPRPFLEKRGGSISTIGVGVGVIVALRAGHMPPVITYVLLGAAALVTALGLWGFFSREHKREAPSSPSAGPAQPLPRERGPAIRIENLEGGDISENEFINVDRPIELGKAKDVDVKKNKFTNPSND